MNHSQTTVGVCFFRWLLRASLLALVPLVVSADLSAQEVPVSPIEQQFLSNIRQLTFEGSRAGEGYFNSDGSLMVFQSERRADNPFFQIYLLDFETGDIEPVSPGHGKTTCAWVHPQDPNLVLFSSTHDDPEARQKQRDEIAFRESGQTRRYAWDYDPHYEIYTYDRAGQTYQRLTHAQGYDAEGSYSPDGSLIAFASNRKGFSEELPDDLKKRFEIDPSILMDIYIMNSDGTNVRQLTNHVGYDGGPFFSPDGSRICWRRFSEDGLRAEIMTMKIDGSDQRQLTQMNVLSWAPFYHPSGKYLIFTTNKHGFGNFELYLVAADGKSMPVRVTDCEGFDGLASFSPDGRQLTWTSARNPKKESQIYLADWNHQGALAALIDSGVSDILAAQAPSHSTPPESAPASAPLPDGFEQWFQTLPDPVRQRIQLADLLTEEPAAAKQGMAASLETAANFQPADLARHVEYLCQPELEGRLTGTPGERMATAYAAGYLAALGLLPGGDQGSWFQNFQFPTGVELGEGNRLTATEVDGTEIELSVGREWRPVAFSANLEIPPTEIVFAGYGIVAPEQAEQPAYNSFADLDVQGKWVMMLRFEPEDVSAERRTHLQFYSGIRKKAFYARELGAKGVIFVSGPTAKVQDQLVPLQRDFAPSGFSLAAISISDDVASDWLAAANRDLAELQNELNSGAVVPGFSIPDVRLGGRFQINSTTGTGRNVIARIQAKATPSPSAVLIGAHIDHLGRGEMGTSLAKGEEVGQIHFGADDNASGVAAVLEIAEYIADQQRQGKLKLQHDIVFAIWSGEELGLHGSKHFVRQLNTAPEESGKGQSSRQFVVGIDQQGEITVNGKSAQYQELAGSLAYLGTNHPDFVVEVQQNAAAPPEKVAQLMDLAEKNGVQHLKIVMQSEDQAENQTEVRPLVAALNMDMIGRFRDKLILQGTGSSDYWAKAIESRNAVLGLPIALNSDTNLPTDASSFYAAGVPILSAFTGSHADYHTPRDTPDKINYEGAAKVARLMALITRGLATDAQIPNYRRQELQVQRTPRAGLRAYLGTAPSYGEDIIGVLLYDITPGSPADKAGVKAGDVIVGLGSKTIEDIYDYTAALDAIKVGEETEIVVEREGQELKLKIVPSSRQ